MGTAGDSRGQQGTGPPRVAPRPRRVCPGGRDRDKNGAGGGETPNLQRHWKAMPLPVLALLLLLLAARPGAALDGPGEPREGSEEPAGSADFLSRQLQSLSELVSRELPPQLRPQELRAQAGLYLERANKQLEPLARELQNNVLGLFSSLLGLRRAESPESP